MKMNEKIDKLRAAVQDVIDGIEKGDKSDSPLGAVYTVKFSESKVIDLKQLLEDTDS